MQRSRSDGWSNLTASLRRWRSRRKHMKTRLIAIAAAASLACAAGVYAEAPAGSTGECKDGTYTDAGSKRGACAGHGGVKQWYGKASSTAKTAPAAAPPAAAQGAKPAGATGECKDGTFSDAASKRGACAGHGGVKTWYGKPRSSAKATAAPAATPAPAAPAPSPTAAAATPAAAAPAAGATAKPAAATPAAKTTEMPAQAAPGGGPGKVWVNASTKVYHCPSDRWYGKTKEGEYMSEAEAKAKGDRPASGKPCS
jgi:Protein of unknown function (DUF3761)